MIIELDDFLHNLLLATLTQHVYYNSSLLKCYCHLTEWSDLEKAALVNVDDSPTPKLQKLWEDSYYHVSYFIMFLRHVKI